VIHQSRGEARNLGFPEDGGLRDGLDEAREVLAVGLRAGQRQRVQRRSLPRPRPVSGVGP
jgi:hypothetical protein